MDFSYLKYVHNLNIRSFDQLKPNSKQTILALLKDNFDSIRHFKNSIIKETSPEVLSFITRNLSLDANFRKIIFTTDSTSYLDDVDLSDIKGIINFKKINSLKDINEHFRSVNKLLDNGGIYIGRAETYFLKKKITIEKYGKNIGLIVWRFDFLFNRVLPKIRFINVLYYLIRQRRINKSLSQAELLGRLVYCGFKVQNYGIINDYFYFSVVKRGDPLDCPRSSANPLIKLSRVGKDGKMFFVYKFRTMHPYSEYLQDYLIQLNGYNEKGKPPRDFRVTQWGKFMRRLWIDELPQIINVILGNMRIVGIRPVSKIRLNEFPDDLKEERLKHKPGCIPPYVALCMPDEKGNIEAERIYLKERKKNPFLTDVKYTFKAIYNILFNKIRSS